MKKLEGKVAIVTGSSNGIGMGIAKMFAAEGAKVVVNDIDAGNGERVAAAIRAAGGGALGLSLSRAPSVPLGPRMPTGTTGYCRFTGTGSVNPNVALFFAVLVTMYLLISARGASLSEISRMAEDSFASAGTIILITAAGGAYALKRGKFSLRGRSVTRVA